MISIVLSAFLLAGSTPASTPLLVAKAPKAERKICKRETISTSLHGSKRVCLTAVEWKARERNSSLEDMGGVTSK